MNIIKAIIAMLLIMNNRAKVTDCPKLEEAFMILFSIIN